MPTYDFKCTSAECEKVVEKILPIAARNEPGPCECGGALERVYLTPRQSDAQRFDPIVVHVDPRTGEYRIPGAGDARCPEGYERQELRTIRDIEKFERHANRIERGKSDLHAIREKSYIEHLQHERRGELREAMKGMSNFGRDLARVAMARNDARIPTAHDCGVHFEILHNDRSNRDEHRDVRTGWKRGRD
jgi:hypothetical protein